MDVRLICDDLTTRERSTGTPASMVMPAQTHNSTKSLLMFNILNSFNCSRCFNLQRYIFQHNNNNFNPRKTQNKNLEVQIRSAKGVSNGALAVKHEKRTGERQAARGRAPTSVFRLKRVNSQQKREAATSPRD